MVRLKWNLIPDWARWDYWLISIILIDTPEEIPKYLSEVLESQIYIINGR